MLYKPDINIKRIMRLATIIEHSSDYDQGDIQHCICGKACKAWQGMFDPFWPPRTPSYERGQDILGLTKDQAHDLFQTVETTPAKTARVLRHLATTGEVDWAIA